MPQFNEKCICNGEKFGVRKARDKSFVLYRYNGEEWKELEQHRPDLNTTMKEWLEEQAEWYSN